MSKRRAPEPRTLEEARRVAALSVPAAAHLAGVSESKMYQAAARGEVESIRAFGRVLIPTRSFLALFGVDVVPDEADRS